MAATAYCPGCGRLSQDCGGCLSPHDPPHYCAQCGERMAVNVRTVGWKARCKTHGEITSP